MNGLDAASHLKKQSPKIPIVMLTTFKGNFLEQRAYKAGVSLVLSKEERMLNSNFCQACGNAGEVCGQ